MASPVLSRGEGSHLSISWQLSSQCSPRPWTLIAIRGTHSALYSPGLPGRLKESCFSTGWSPAGTALWLYFFSNCRRFLSAYFWKGWPSEIPLDGSMNLWVYKPHLPVLRHWQTSWGHAPPRHPEYYWNVEQSWIQCWCLGYRTRCCPHLGFMLLITTLWVQLFHQFSVCFTVYSSSLIRFFLKNLWETLSKTSLKWK